MTHISTATKATKHPTSPKTEQLTPEQQALQDQFNHQMRIFSTLNKIDLTVNKDSVISTFKKEDLKRYLRDISKPDNQKKLREISRALYLTSPHYRSLINHYSTLYNFDYVVENHGLEDYSKVDIDRYKKAYFRAISNAEKKNIKLESLKIRVNAYIDGVFYGYARSDKNGFYIQRFEPEYCAITHIDPTSGLFGYSFDFSIFRRDRNLLRNYPDEFTTIYNQLETSEARSYWARVEGVEAICIKTSPWNHPVPPLVGLFEGILDIADFKALNKGNEEMGNYKLIFQQIPMKDGRDATKDEFLISEDFVQQFHANIAANLPPQIGLLTTPMKVEAIKFEKDSVDKNKVGEATSQYWNEAGVSELLFGNNTTSAALKYSIIATESSLVTIVREIEKWINELEKSEQRGAYRFRTRVLDTTKFNVSDFFTDRLKAAQFGLPVKNELVAILGMQPSAMEANVFLENVVLGLTDKLIPLKSSHTSDGADEGGRPVENDEGELTEAGEQSRENDVNAE